MDDVVGALLRGQHYPPSMREKICSAVEEAREMGISPVEVAVAQAFKPDKEERRDFFQKILKPMKVRKTSRGHRSSKSIEKKRSKYFDKTKNLQEPEGCMLRPNYEHHVLVGDSNLRNFAESLGYLPTYEGKVKTIGHCWGGATIREVAEEISKMREDKHIVMVGLNDILRPNKVQTIRNDFGRLLTVLSHGSRKAILISPPPLPREWNLPVDTVIEEMALQVQSESNVHFLDLRPYFQQGGRLLSQLYKRDGMHLSAEGLAVLRGALQIAM